jgi:hypothetical protein
MPKYIRYFISSFILTSLLLTGCQYRNDLTEPKYLTGNNLQIKVSFRKATNPSKYHYYLIFSNNQTPVLPSTGKYIILPGQTYNEDALSRGVPVGEGLNYLYRNYFSTWSDYLYFNNSSFYLYASDSLFSKDISDSTGHYNYHYSSYFQNAAANNSSTMTVTLPIAQLSNMADKLYFSILTTDAATDTALDILDSSPELPIIAVTTKSGTDLEDQTIDGSADILSWEVRIF